MLCYIMLPEIGWRQQGHQSIPTLSTNMAQILITCTEENTHTHANTHSYKTYVNLFNMHFVHIHHYVEIITHIQQRMAIKCL